TQNLYLRGHEHGLRARAPRHHETERCGGAHRRLHRAARPGPGEARRRHARARARHPRRQRCATVSRRPRVHPTRQGARMIRISEMVLPGHPDKFCDQVADAVIAECVAIDPEVYGQVEVSTWSDQVWLSGGVCTRRPLAKSMRDIVVETGLALGYVPGNHIDATRYQVTSTVCERIGDPAQWSRHVNDQSVVIGWAGYDAKVRYLPPEHFLAHALREALLQSCRDGLLMGQGPDGKLMVRLREEGRRWTLEHVLVTLQQSDAAVFMEVCCAIARVLEDAYA